ncbi:MAG: flagellar hook-basal body complex protein [Synergistaceae bacterium]|nr:flagellar hook-basal body complex protein [Synergistaceae bacterium]
MLRSLMTGVTGIRAHQTMLDVVGNNVANVNTTGYKKSSTVFQDLLYQNSRGATAPGDNRGGINPLQIGLGVQVAGVELVNTAAPLQYTGNRTDVAIQGDGLFVLSDGMNKLYTRAGNFSLDADGVLDHVGTGFRVQGYQMVQDPANPLNYIQDGKLGDIQLKIGDKIEAKETNLVGYKCNLDSRVGTYLPFGITNMNATTTLNSDVVGELPFNCTIINTGSAGGAATTFTTYEIKDELGVTLATVNLEMVSIIDGKPVLRLVDNSGVSVADISITGSSDVITYDNGILRIVADNGRVTWNANILSGAEYSSFKLEDKTSPPTLTYNVLLEFDEGNISKSVMPAILWLDDGAGTPTSLKRIKLDIPTNADGTFDIPENGLDLATISSGDDFPTLWNTPGNIILKPAADGYGIQILGVTDAADLEFSVFNVTTQDMTATHSTKGDIFDCQGIAHVLEVVFKKVGENNWRWEAYFPNEPDLIPDPPNGYIEFGPCGKLISPSFVEVEIPYSVTGAKDAKVTLDFSGKMFGYDDVLEGITQYGSPKTTKAWFQDGYAMGVLNDFYVANDGTIYGRYDNNQNIPLYRLALATFANPNGLERVGNTAFRESANSGMAQIGAPMEGGAGEVIGNNLEMSNVDIAEEFTRLILAQRGFQANARVVTVSDGMLEELVNLKR